MADQTKIEWTDATWNVVNGCTLVSDGCKNCYAANLAATRLKYHPSRTGLARKTRDGVAKFTGQVRFNEKVLTDPLRWKRPRKIFVCAHGDLFHENVPDSWIDQVFAVMALCPQHIFQVLTKRPERMHAYLTNQPRARRRWEDIIRETHGVTTKSPPPILPNVWLGVSTEDQETADERIPWLLAAPAAIRFLSAEPLLGPLDLEAAWAGETALAAECWGDCGWCKNGLPPLHNCRSGRQSNTEFAKGRSGLDWVIVGGESGKNARPMHPEWAREIRDQCLQADVPFLFKQWGAWVEVDGNELPDRFTDPECDQFRCISSCGFVGDLSIGSAFLHKPDRFPDCFPGGADSEAICNSIFVKRVGKKAAGRLLDGVQHDGFPRQERGAAA